MLPWWAWAILVVLGFAWLLIFAGMSWRRGIRREFIAYLQERDPKLKVLDEHVLYLHVESAKLGVSMVSLAGLYHAAGQSEVRTVQDRREVYERYLAVVEEGVAPSGRKLDRERDAGRIMPRLVTREFFAEEPALAGAPNVPLAKTGLYVVYVLDDDQEVVYLTREHLSQMELREAQAGAMALEHLAASLPLEHLVREAVEKGTVVSVKQLDSYDAARALLLPDLLREGEALVAAIPDRDTLVFTREPPGGRVEEIEGLMVSASDRPLLKRAVRVTSGGIE